MRILGTLAFVTLLATHASAQGLGYAEGGLAGVNGYFGNWSNSFHVGGGAEIVAADRLGFGGEVGFFNRLVVASANATVHLGGVKNAGFSPFVTGGFSVFGIGDGESAINNAYGVFSAYNVGAGLHYWAADRVGFRVEARDHFRLDDRGTTQYWSVRAGIAFR
jgi:hypothetical protein